MGGQMDGKSQSRARERELRRKEGNEEEGKEGGREDLDLFAGQCSAACRLCVPPSICQPSPCPGVWAMPWLVPQWLFRAVVTQTF